MPRALMACVLCVALPGCAILDTNATQSVPAKRQAAGVPPGDTGQATVYWSSQTRSGTAESWFQLGNRQAENGRLTEAEQAYREALKQGNDPRILHNLGLVQVRLGVETLREARRQLPANDPIHRETRQYFKALLEGEM